LAVPDRPEEAGHLPLDLDEFGLVGHGSPLDRVRLSSARERYRSGRNWREEQRATAADSCRRMASALCEGMKSSTAQT
jgi:hypothetical protein